MAMIIFTFLGMDSLGMLESRELQTVTLQQAD